MSVQKQLTLSIPLQHKQIQRYHRYRHKLEAWHHRESCLHLLEAPVQRYLYNTLRRKCWPCKKQQRSQVRIVSAAIAAKALQR
jgi:hypothetical protein